MATPTTQQPPTTPGAKGSNYLTEVRKEMRKVNWPSQRELINNTVLTLVASFVIALFIFGVDNVISRLLSIVYG